MKIDLDLLRLDFTPQSVRDHYDGWGPEAREVTDTELAEAAEMMLCEDYTWQQFGYMMDRIIEILDQRRLAHLTNPN